MYLHLARLDPAMLLLMLIRDYATCRTDSLQYLTAGELKECSTGCMYVVTRFALNRNPKELGKDVTTYTILLACSLI
jgi:hypothetical protein